MSSVTRFNSLHGKTADRNELIQIRQQAIKEGETEVVFRLGKVLTDNPEAQIFELEIVRPAKSVKNEVRLFLDPVPAELLEYLDYEQEQTPFTGLGKAVSSKEIYDMITKRMQEMIKEASGKGYVKKWSEKHSVSGYTIPFNFATKKRYRGVNVLLLTYFKPLKNPFFLTFKQITALNAKLKKGAKGRPVVYFTYLYHFSQAAPKLDFGTYDRAKMVDFLRENWEKIKNKRGYSIDEAGLLADRHTIPVLKYYKVFNGEDIEGIDFGLDKFKVGYIEAEEPDRKNERMEVAEAIVANFPKPAPSIAFGGNKAYYSPPKDHVQLPEFDNFHTSQDYYRTLFHELSHSTGHPNRLARDFSGRFGSKKYAFEELIAEWGATFLSAEAGIIWHTNRNHAEYIKNWNGALTHMKDDNKFIMRACTEAQKVADFVLQFENGDPKYFDYLKKKIEQETKEKKPAKKKTPSKKTGKKPAGPKVKTKSETRIVTPRVSASVSNAIKDVLTLPKYKGISPLVGSLVFKHFRDLEDYGDDVYVELDSDYEKGVLMRKSPIHQVFFDELHLSPTGFDFVQSVNGRLESLRNKKYNHPLFPGLNAPEAAASVPVNAEEPTTAVPAIEPEPISEPPISAEPTQLPKRTQDLMSMKFDSLEFDQGWENFMQNPAKNVRLAVWGLPKNGKTAGSLQLANYLATKFGRVLYNFVDQGFIKSTQDLWIQSGLAQNPNAEPTDVQTLAELEALCATGNYDFVFIDMISDYIRREKINPADFKDRFLKKFPKIGFVLVFEVTKEGNFKGDQGWTHIVDAVVTVKDFLMETRGRYGIGHHVVWEDGLRQFNPSKYDEIFSGQQSDDDPFNAPISQTI